MKFLTPKHFNGKEEGEKMAKCISNCIDKATKENPKLSSATGGELWRAGSNWAARNILITDKKND